MLRRIVSLSLFSKIIICVTLSEALLHLVDYGDLERTLGCYLELMMQRDITNGELNDAREADHRDSFYFCLMRNHFLVPRAEFKVIKVVHYSLLAR